MNGQGMLSVCKLNMVDKLWTEYTQTPGSLFMHLMKPGDVLPIMASHCNSYFLMHVLAQLDVFWRTSLEEPLLQKDNSWIFIR